MSDIYLLYEIEKNVDKNTTFCVHTSKHSQALIVSTNNSIIANLQR